MHRQPQRPEAPLSHLLAGPQTDYISTSQMWHGHNSDLHLPEGQVQSGHLSIICPNSVVFSREQFSTHFLMSLVKSISIPLASSCAVRVGLHDVMVGASRRSSGRPLASHREGAASLPRGRICGGRHQSLPTLAGVPGPVPEGSGSSLRWEGVTVHADPFCQADTGRFSESSLNAQVPPPACGMERGCLSLETVSVCAA